jgi:folate-binding protein YgfZ
MIQSGFAALHRSSAFVQLPDWGVLQVSGRHRERWLQGMITQDIKSLQPGAGRYACVVNVKGRVKADFGVYKDLADASYLLIMLGDLIAPLVEHLKTFIIAERVDLVERSDLGVVTVQGPGAGDALGNPTTDLSEYSPFDALLARRHRTVAGGFDVLVPSAQVDALTAGLLERGAAHATLDDLECGRLEAAIPQFDHDMAQGVFPQEAGLTDALHWTKGCYVGQEVVARLEHRGHTNRELRQLQITADAPLNPGAEIFAVDAPDKKIGTLTSNVLLPGSSTIVAIAMLRRSHFDPGTELVIVDGNHHFKAEVTARAIRAHAVSK